MADKPFINTKQETFAEFVGERGRCFYIPPYQRGFTWDRENFHRSFEDITSGIEQLFDERSDQSSTFIGTIICFHDREYKTIKPIVRADVPAAIYDVIDGQQRLTMLLMIAVLLHDYIRIRWSKYKGTWLGDKAEESLKEIADVIENDKGSGERRFYPKMIRAFIDQWSKQEKLCKYHSPLSHFIASYGLHIRGEEGEKGNAYKHNIPPDELSEEQRKEHKNFDSLITFTCRVIKDICSNSGKRDDSLQLPEISKMIDDKKFILAIFNIVGLEPGDVNIEEKKQCELFLALVLTSYILNRIHIVTLVTIDENSSFDIFEALNTTGQVLTALETFKPAVVDFERTSEFEESESKKHLDPIYSYMDTLTGTNERSKISSEIVINFALAESGDKISRHLASQRKYLRGNYDEVNIEREKREFTRHLMCVSQVVQHFWGTKAGENLLSLPQYQGLDSEVLQEKLRKICFCLKYLTASKHTISRSLISRFCHAVVISEQGNRIQSIHNLFDAIMAISAFFALWRGTRDRTDGIDKYYRDLMRNGVGEGPAFCRKNSLPPVEDLKKAFVYLLCNDGGNSRTKVSSSDEFIKYSGEVPIYATQKHTAKFLLLVALHDAELHDERAGYLVRGRLGVNPVISQDNWLAPSYETIEHIIPSSKADDIPGVSARDLDKLGNLLLVPKQVNSILGVDEHEDKSKIYSILGSKTEEQLNQKIKEANLKGEIENALKKPGYLSMMKTIVDYESFTPDNIETRGKNLAELAWKTLAEDWLNFDSSS